MLLKRGVILLGALAMTAMLSLTSVAQDNTAPCPLPSDPAVLVSIVWPLLDANADGSVSTAELSGLIPGAFVSYISYVDANGNGSVEQAEILALLPLLQMYLDVNLLSFVDTNANNLIEYSEVGQYASQAQFDALDVNGNGVIDCGDLGDTSPVEGELEGSSDVEGDPTVDPPVTCPLPSDPALLIPALFPVVDTDGDGGISWAEVNAIVPLSDSEIQYFNLLDSNRDGVVTLSELTPFLPLLQSVLPADWMSSVDLNGDGVIQYAEISEYATEAQFAQLDKNGNGVLDCGDVDAPPPPAQYQLILQVTPSNGGAVTVNAAGISSTASPDGQVYVFPAGAVVTIAVQPNSGWMLSNITGAEGAPINSVQTFTVVLDSDKTVTIEFAPLGPVEGEPEGGSDVLCPLPNDPMVLLSALLPVVDTDGDGGISWAEVNALVPLSDSDRQYFDMLDANRDGVVTLAEIAPFSSLLSAVLGSADLVGYVDANGDGVIQFEEVSAYATQEQFTLLDKNGNGVIDCGDVGALPPVEGEPEGDPIAPCPLPDNARVLLEFVYPFVDTDGSGGISIDELIAIYAQIVYDTFDETPFQTLRPYFAMADTNGDGEVTIDELLSVVLPLIGDNLLSLIDTDGDGAISPSETGEFVPFGLFTMLDANGNGVIDCGDIGALPPVEGEPEGDPVAPCPLPADPRVLLEAVYPFVDTDGSGGISWAEIENLLSDMVFITIYPSPLDILYQYFVMADGNSNGEVTIDELLALVLPLIGGDLLGVIDTNGDGVISLDETGGYVPADIFAMLDVNGNGVLDCGDIGGIVTPTDQYRLVVNMMPINGGVLSLNPVGITAAQLAHAASIYLYPANTVVTLAIQPNPGWQLAGVDGLDTTTASGAVTYSMLMDSNKVINVRFLPEGTVEGEPEGTVEGDPNVTPCPLPLDPQVLLEAVYPYVDVDGSGGISMAEIEALMAQFPYVITIFPSLTDQIQPYFDMADADANGEVTIDELLAILLPLIGGNPLSLIDTNGDGVISLNETGGYIPPTIFAMLDANGNGVIDCGDLGGYVDPDPDPVCPISLDLTTLLSMVMPVLDPDGNSAISIAEIQALIPQMDASILAMLDRDGDGLVTLEEVMAFLPMIQQLLLPAIDPNGDGVIAFDEVSAYVTREQFALVDTNGDGVLDCYDVPGVTPPQIDPCDVVRPLLDNWTALDANNDGALSLDEMHAVAGGAMMMIGADGSIASGANIFALLDEDGDGLVQQSELARFNCVPVIDPGQYCPLLQDTAALAALLIGLADTDGDGQLSEAEFDAVVPGLPIMTILPMLDTTCVDANGSATSILPMPDPFDMLDTNGDGMLSSDEVAAVLGQAMAFFDTNGDGVVSLDEFNALMAPFDIDVTVAFSMLDQNGNGVLDCGDYGAVIPDPDPDPEPVVDRCAIARQLVENWDALDANDDGEITRDELVIVLDSTGAMNVDSNGWGSLDLFSVLDIDSNGVIELAEANGIVEACDGAAIDHPNFGHILPILEALFSQFDTNGDGGLSLDEVSAIYPIPEAVFAQLDLNGDGLLSLSDLQGTDDDVTNPVDPTEPVDPDSLLTLTCSAAGNGMYTPGQPMALAIAIEKQGDAAIAALGLSVTLPAGWALVEAGDTGAIASPAAGDTGVLEWAWARIPSFPLSVSVRIAVPADATGPQTLTAEALYRTETSEELSTGVVSVIVPQGYGPERTHSADVNHDWSINLSEILRVVQFFNVQGYHCDSTTEDGFLPGAGDISCGAHNSDFAPKDGVINLSELLRLVQMFNVPSRAYYVLDTTDDGFSPGLFTWSFTSK